MNPKKIVKLIEKIDYTIAYERNGVPLTSYDEGFKLACNMIKDAVKAMTFSKIKFYFYKIRIHPEGSNGKEEKKEEKSKEEIH